MPNLKNVENLKSLKEAFKKAASVVFIDYSKLTSNQINELRNKLREVNGTMKVAKNTLLNIALGGSKEKKKVDLEGQTAVIFAKQDPISPIKALYDFIKENDLPKVKIGIFEGDFIEEARVAEISAIPSKDELLARIASGFNSPIFGFVNVLGGTRSGFVRVIKQLAESRER